MEEYTWAGETRVRATSLLEGPLAHHGFQRPAKSDETEDVDIDGMDDDGETFGQSQYPFAVWGSTLDCMSTGQVNNHAPVT